MKDFEKFCKKQINLLFVSRANVYWNGEWLD